MSRHKKYDYSDTVSDETGEEETSVAPEPYTPYNKVSDQVKLRSLYDARLRYTGRLSGKQYEWTRAGSVVSVSNEDVSYLMSKKVGTGCCGANSDGRIFEIVN
jgi:hypothetical protein